MGISYLMIAEKASYSNISTLGENDRMDLFKFQYIQKQQWDPTKICEMNLQLWFMLWPFISMKYQRWILYVKYRYRWQILVIFILQRTWSSILVTL